MTEASNASKAEKSIAFFKDSKVDSCCYVAVKHGQPVAIAYGVAALPKVNESPLMERRSYSHDVHKVRNYLYAGMNNKPLQPYSPDAQRSRLRVDEKPIPHKNSSSLVIGDRNSNRKKHFVTTAQELLRKPKPVMTSNLGILSAKAKWQRKMFDY